MVRNTVYLTALHVKRYQQNQKKTHQDGPLTEKAGFWKLYIFMPILRLEKDSEWDYLHASHSQRRQFVTVGLQSLL